MGMKELTSFQRDCVSVIAGLEDPSGTAIKDQLNECYDEGVYAGRLYSNLDTLVEEGYVEKRPQSDRTNSYRLTEEGKAALKDHVEWLQRYTRDLDVRRRAAPATP